MVSTAIILAGGLGTRLRSAVPDLPKPMAPVNGRPFLSVLMDYWMGQGIQRFILSVGYKSYAILDYYGGSYRGVELIYSVEEKPLGTGGGLLKAIRCLQDDDSFLVLNGDTFFAVELDGLRKCHEHTQADMTMSLFNVADNDRYGGVEMDAEGRIISLAASRVGSVHRRVNGGVYLMRPDLFDRYWEDLPAQPCSLEDDLFPWLIGNGRHITGHLATGLFIDIGVPEDYQRASTLLAEVAA